MHTDRVSISAFVDPVDHRRLLKRAQAEERSASAVIRLALRQYLAHPTAAPAVASAEDDE